uniref:RGS domain-containing protein n=1 Tax=Mycena chlorophos TaxID=658473 RepID=A0ABQ0MDY5_MYCCL|nr:predicted protein [Mycena chlorophos]
MNPAPAQARPRTTEISLRSLLSLPFRLCNPPPPAAKRRSCGVQPALQVRLDEVLDRNHLPPLGLKDFEEWLLYCEDAVENLYFILWLKEYTLRYKQWVARLSFERNNAGESYVDRYTYPRNSLAIFYARARITFLSPNAIYELNVPSSTLAPFHASDGSPHPDPAIFTPIAIETRKMLEDSLERFVAAQLSNVGNSRAFCGMTAGVLFMLIGALIPIIYNFATSHSRWLRLTSLPGLWMGLTTLLASLNGVCVGVYIFGDLRQLRKFELARPAISKPQPLSLARFRPNMSSGFIPSIPVSQPRITIIPPQPAHVHSPRSVSRLSAASTASSETHSSYSEETDEIHISPAYYDEDDVDGPATSPVASENLGIFALPPPPPPKIEVKDVEGGFMPTAAFIHPFDDFPAEDPDDQFAGPPRVLPEERQILSPFDFEALPRTYVAQKAPRSPAQTNIDIKLSLKGFIGRMQAKCAPRWVVPTIVGEDEKDNSPDATEKRASRPNMDASRERPRPDKNAVDKQFKRVRAVPAFAVPLTPILSPVVVRGQWEIVVRSMLFALLFSVSFVAVLLAIPPPHGR